MNQKAIKSKEEIDAALNERHSPEIQSCSIEPEMWRLPDLADLVPMWHIHLTQNRCWASSSD